MTRPKGVNDDNFDLPRGFDINRLRIRKSPHNEADEPQPTKQVYFNCGYGIDEHADDNERYCVYYPNESNHMPVNDTARIDFLCRVLRQGQVWYLSIIQLRFPQEESTASTVLVDC